MTKKGPLGQAAADGEIQIARLVIGRVCALPTENGWTELHITSQSVHLDVVRLLLRRRADVNVVDKVNKTAAELALENNRADVAWFLAGYKAIPNVRSTLPRPHWR